MGKDQSSSDLQRAVAKTLGIEIYPKPSDDLAPSVSLARDKKKKQQKVTQTQDVSSANLTGAMSKALDIPIFKSN